MKPLGHQGARPISQRIRKGFETITSFAEEPAWTPRVVRAWLSTLGKRPLAPFSYPAFISSNLCVRKGRKSLWSCRPNTAPIRLPEATACQTAANCKVGTCVLTYIHEEYCFNVSVHAGLTETVKEPPHVAKTVAADVQDRSRNESWQPHTWSCR